VARNRVGKPFRATRAQGTALHERNDQNEDGTGAAMHGRTLATPLEWVKLVDDAQASRRDGTGLLSGKTVTDVPIGRATGR